MPAAPLAKGLIISISILIAAGFAVYENPQVREWVDTSRRKIAVALHSLGDEIQPSRSQSEDASTREDESVEAAERRRRAREEIMEKGRINEENRRRSKQYKATKGKSFDDIVDEQGLLKKEATDEATTTAAQPNSEAEGLRKRNTETQGIAMGATLANPFSDEMHPNIFFTSSPIVPEDPIQRSRESTATLQTSPPIPPKIPLHAEQHPLLINTEETSNHLSEQLIDLTPPTNNSVPQSDHYFEAPQPSNYWSVNEWAESTSPSFYSPPQSEATGQRLQNGTDEGIETAMSDAGSGEDVGRMSQIGDDSDVDAMSEIGGGVSTPGSWTDVGSVVSEDGQ